MVGEGVFRGVERQPGARYFSAPIVPLAGNTLIESSGDGRMGAWGHLCRGGKMKGRREESGTGQKGR